ncbi:hypothetical protein [Bacteroides sedimenti]|uniref:Uncharacterized protein n=1 Tax=Bacteroides sedimenti TaxID=2136147 RepID=A0ABM8I7M2_9BACE
MKTNVINEVREFFKDLSTDICVNDHLTDEDIENVIDNVTHEDAYDAIESLLNDNGVFESEGEIIYSTKAINFLAEHDASLNRSLKIAEEYGYTPSNLDSEILATLLYTEMLKEEFQGLRAEINDFFNELEYNEEEE